MTTILVVDDSTTIRRMVIASLHQINGVRFVQAGNGLEAIEQLALMPIDIIILDLNMPDMHGLEVVQFVRAHQAYRAIPIVILTTRSDETSREAVLTAGASAYLTKPFSPHTLSACVIELLEAV
jgi:two-component system chemotaxis response regulator CheY